MVIKPRPVRHFPGKATGNSSSSESEESEDEQKKVQQQHRRKHTAPPPKVSSAGKIISSGNAPPKPALVAAAVQQRPTTEELEKKAAEEGFVTEEESGDEGPTAAAAAVGGSSSEEDDSDDEEEDESSEEDERPRRNLMLRPKFIPKSQRLGGNGAQQYTEAEESRKAEEEAERKIAEADTMIEEQIRKDQAARKAGKNFWEDADEAVGTDVDTEDDKDPEAEYAAWKVRELKRIKRDREAVEEREKEIAEIERRRNLTVEERRREDEEHLAKQQEEKDSKGKMGFMGKYFHKGAFFQDSKEAEELAKRDVMGAKFEDEVDRSLLPKALQMRDFTKLGKKSASKYRDLKSEDTGRWAEHRDHRPGRDREGDWRGKDREGPAGANAIPLGERKPGQDRDGGKERDSNSNRPRSKDGFDDRRRRDSRSRSRSPRRDRNKDDYSHRRKRDSSRDGDRYDSDKRRRVDER